MVYNMRVQEEWAYNISNRVKSWTAVLFFVVIVLVAPLSLPAVTDAAANCGSKPTFLGLVPWYQYLTVQTTTVKNQDGTTATVCQIQNFGGTSTQVLGGSSPFLLIGLAIIDDLLRVSALAAVGYIIYGGFTYMTSNGSPDGTKRAQQTIINASVGLVIAISAAGIVAFIGNKLSTGG